MFFQLFIDSMNPKTMLKKYILFGVWYIFLWFSSIKGIHTINITNFTNCVMGFIWIILREDAHSLCLVSTESLEHYFGHVKTWNSELSTMDFICLKKLDVCLVYISHSNLVSVRVDSKGYISKFNGLRENVEAVLWSRSGEESVEESGILVQVFSHIQWL